MKYFDCTSKIAHILANLGGRDKVTDIIAL